MLYSPDKSTILRWGAFLGGEVLLTLILAFSGLLSVPTASFVLGLGATALNVCMYGAPVSAFIDAVRRQNTEVRGFPLKILFIDLTLLIPCVPLSRAHTVIGHHVVKEGGAVAFIHPRSHFSRVVIRCC